MYHRAMDSRKVWVRSRVVMVEMLRGIRDMQGNFPPPLHPDIHKQVILQLSFWKILQ